LKHVRGRLGFLALCLFTLLLLYLVAWPVPIDPVAWQPEPAPPLTGSYAPNSALASVERIPVGGVGPEHVSVGPEGWLYTGLEDGRVIRMQADGSQLMVVANTGGRPQSVEIDRAGNLIVADTQRGLLSIDPRGALRVLTTEADGVPFRFTNDVAIASDGTIYFTDSSHKFEQSQVPEEVIEHGAHGRLLAYDSTTGATRVLIEGLRMANGVALSPDESFLLVNETTAYRTRRLWLKTKRAGEEETFLENLPGLPDNIRCTSRGICWVALFAPRIPALDALAPYPFLRKLMLRFPSALRPKAQPYALVLGVDFDGNVVANLQDPSPGCFAPITGVTEHDGFLYLGSLHQREIARLPVPR